MEIEWADAAKVSARGFMRDQDGMRAVAVAVNALADDPYPGPPAAFHRGIWNRLHVGPYRVTYYVDGDVIMIRRVDRVKE